MEVEVKWLKLIWHIIDFTLTKMGNWGLGLIFLSSVIYAITHGGSTLNALFELFRKASTGNV